MGRKTVCAQLQCPHPASDIMLSRVETAKNRWLVAAPWLQTPHHDLLRITKGLQQMCSWSADFGCVLAHIPDCYCRGSHLGVLKGEERVMACAQLRIHYRREFSKFTLLGVHWHPHRVNHRADDSALFSRINRIELAQGPLGMTKIQCQAYLSLK